MAQQPKQAQPDRPADGYQEGSRWINRRPTGEEVAAWFMDNAPMHEGMDPKRYVTGVTLIPAKEKVRVMRMRPQTGAMFMVEEEQLVYTPYVKVETRVAYFWDLMRVQETVGVIEPAKVKQHKDLRNEHLPPGFFRMVIRKADGKDVNFLACSMQVWVYAGDDSRPQGRGRALMEPPAGTKMVAELTKYGEDPFVVMKAETGAVGRALGMAGMLVLPGSGVATAEDMQEAATAGGGGSVDALLPEQEEPGAPQEPQADAAQAPDAEIRKRIAELSAQLESDNPGGFEQVQEWAAERKIDLNNIKAEQLRGVLRQIERAMA